MYSVGPVLLLLPDLGLDGLSNFSSLLSAPALLPATTRFRVLCVTAPGAEAGAKPLQGGFPSLVQLADTIATLIAVR